MLIYPDINPIALDLGAIKIHWYGISYLCAFAGCWGLLRYRIKLNRSPFVAKQIEDLIFYGALGVILGGRIGYTLFYNWIQFIENPLVLFQIWNGGMSFHGGLIGVLLAMLWYAKKSGIRFFSITDEIAIVVPWGLACGRIGNFINAELWGRPSDLPWAMIFPTDPFQIPRHPSMLYEFLFEGLILLAILWIVAIKPRPRMMVSALFLGCYGIMRFGVEFVRQPDAHMGDGGFIFAGWLTQGMLLSLPMVAFAGFLFWLSCKQASKIEKREHI